MERRNDEVGKCTVGWWMWYVPVVGITMLAYLYARWTNRVRGPQEPTDSVQAYERFKAAMAAPAQVPQQRRPLHLGRLSLRR